MTHKPFVQKLLLLLLLMLSLVSTGIAQAQSAPPVPASRFNIPTDAQGNVYPITARTGLGSTCTAETLNAAIAALGSAKVVLPLSAEDGAGDPCTWTLEMDVTLPATMTLLIAAPLVVNEGVTLTLQTCPVLLLGEALWYTGAGTVVLNNCHLPGDGMRAWVRPGSCIPAIPASSLTFVAFACHGYVYDGNRSWLYVPQAAASVGPFNQGNGTYWLALHRDTEMAVSGWTRQAGTHYLWKLAGSLPANPTGGLVFGQVPVVSGAIFTFTLVAPTTPIP